ncbi:hypothetical protein AN389_00941 [Pseudoalteromonas sp. P1-7a]|nr:hypothetical protein AN389_00941 [Pseudoalteromonas sp. P1-7a]
MVLSKQKILLFNCSKRDIFNADSDTFSPQINKVLLMGDIIR